MSPKKILFLMVDGFDTPTSINQLIETLLCDILDEGVEVHMVAGRKGGPLPDVPDSLLCRDGFTYEIVDRGWSVDKRNFIKRFFSDFAYVSKAKSAWRKVIDDVDCVLLQSTPLGALHAASLKRHSRSLPIVYNMYDIFPDNTKNVIGKAPYIFFSHLQRHLYRLCDCIVVVSDDMRETLARKGVPRKKLDVVPNWYDEQSVVEVRPEDNRFLAKYDIDTEKFIVQFAGSIGYVFDCDFVLETAELLRDNHGIEFHIIGQGARFEGFKSEARKRDLSQIRFFPWQPIEEIADVYSACSIGFIPLEQDVIRCAYPSKTSLLMACGRPVVYSVEENSLFSQTIETEKIGWCVPRGDSKQAAAKILELSRKPSAVIECSIRAARYAVDNLSRKANTAKFITVLKEASR